MKRKYLEIYHSGELNKRIKILYERLEACDICPRQCKVNRMAGKVGACHSGYNPIIASYCDHHGEEPVLSGTRGSGTIFIANCNLQCVYCQNYQISQSWKSFENTSITIDKLAEYMIYLQNVLGCHNINFVSPTHFVPQIVKAISIAIYYGLHIPLVYNTNAYDNLETLKLIDGVFDIYLPDIKYASNEHALKYSNAPNYVEISRSAIYEMYRQVGDLHINENGIAEKGLIIRHLVLPNDIAGSRENLEWIATNLSKTVTLSIMAQYRPMHQAYNYPEINRCISASEYENVALILEKLGFENGWLQELDAANLYIPDFNRRRHPFK